MQVINTEKSPKHHTSSLRETPSYLKSKVKPYREADLLVDNFKRATEKLKGETRHSTVESNCMTSGFPILTT